MAQSIWSGEDPVANAMRKDEREARQRAARERDQRLKAAAKTIRNSTRSI